jgi:hypothetical protein
MSKDFIIYTNLDSSIRRQIEKEIVDLRFSVEVLPRSEKLAFSFCPRNEGYLETDDYIEVQFSESFVSGLNSTDIIERLAEAIHMTDEIISNPDTWWLLSLRENKNTPVAFARQFDPGQLTIAIIKFFPRCLMIDSIHALARQKLQLNNKTCNFTLFNQIKD